MDKAELPKLYKRFWLNEDEGTAYCVIEAALEAAWHYEDGFQLEANVQLKDCSRQIDLEFSPWKEKDNQIRLTKLQQIIDALEELKAFMIANPTVEGKVRKPKKEKKQENPLAYLLNDIEEENTDAGKADEGI